jgi:hypothetical protein
MEPAQNGQGRQDPPKEPSLLNKRNHDFSSTNAHEQPSLGFRPITTTKVAWQPSLGDYTM